MKDMDNSIFSNENELSDEALDSVVGGMSKKAAKALDRLTYWKNKGDISQEAYDEATIVFKTQNDTFIFKYLEKKMSHPSGAERKTWIDIFGKFAK